MAKAKHPTQPEPSATRQQVGDPASVEVQLASFIDKFEPGLAKLIRECRAEVRRLLPGPRPNFLDHQEGVINGMQSGVRQGDAGGEPLRSSRRQGAAHALLLLKGAAARVENP